jgi:ribulose-5-phosphate 4-epimerase/fuculose-1-phosphate aldolase
MKEALEGLKRICDAIGGRVDLTQGGGANISVKTPGGMLIKASGFSLATMIGRGGYVLVDYRLLADLYLGGKEVDEEEARRSLREALRSQGEKRPSIEAGFHSYLPTHVIHTHPLFLNAILASTECERLLEEAYAETSYHLVEYARVGHRLAAEVAKAYRRSTTGPPFIFFLKNHGLIVAGEDLDECIGLTDTVAWEAQRIVEERTGIVVPPYTPPRPHTVGAERGYLGAACSPSDVFLFPDAVVFLHSLGKEGAPFRLVQDRVFYSLPYESARNIDEVLYAHTHLLRLTERLGGATPLPPGEVEGLLAMEEEKHRQGMVGM